MSFGHHNTLGSWSEYVSLLSFYKKGADAEKAGDLLQSASWHQTQPAFAPGAPALGWLLWCPGDGAALS